jgi:hypothetical protein
MKTIRFYLKSEKKGLVLNGAGLYDNRILIEETNDVDLIYRFNYDAFKRAKAFTVYGNDGTKLGVIGDEKLAFKFAKMCSKDGWINDLGDMVAGGTYVCVDVKVKDIDSFDDYKTMQYGLAV